MRETRTAQTSIFDFYSQHEFSDFLRSLSDLLDSHPELLKLMEKDLLTDGPQATGRKGLSVESIFRCMLLKQITGVSYEMLAFHLTDSHSYRAFARLDRNSHPGKSVLSCNIRRLRVETLEKIFRELSEKIFDKGTINIDLLRLDSTVVKSNIAPPMDSHLLDDGIRVLSRYFAKSRDCTGVKLQLTDYRKKSRSLAASIFYAKKAEKDALYEELVPLAWKVIIQSERAIKQVKQQCNSDVLSQPWIEQVEHYQHLLKKVIDQTQRRVFNDEDVPATEKIVSLFEPHTDIIIKGSRDIEYGHKINLATDKSGLITAMMIENGNPKDTELFIPLLEQYQSLYGCTPNTTIADGGYASQDNIDRGKAMGIKRVAFHKKNGLTLKAMGIQEKTLKKLKNFRAGIEGNISELKRAFGAGKALWKGEEGFMAYVWSSVISYNITRLVRLNSG
jgi:transposase, IS5 family